MAKWVESRTTPPFVTFAKLTHPTNMHTHIHYCTILYMRGKSFIICMMHVCAHEISIHRYRYIQWGCIKVLSLFAYIVNCTRASHAQCPGKHYQQYLSLPIFKLTTSSFILSTFQIFYTLAPHSPTTVKLIFFNF